MVKRRYWRGLLEAAWEKRSILWLSGVRRVGKTYLCKSLPGIEYFDCELPSARRMMQDPEAFLDGLRGKRIVLDEIHRLSNPSELLKIAADHYRDIHVIATGSSTLGASRKFRDTLTGRKRDIWLTPMTLSDLADAKATSLEHRFLRGGLPPFFLEPEVDERDFQEWMDAYWAKDIQEMFRLERRDSFQKLTELILTQSGGIFEATHFAGPCEVSRPTITNYLRVLEATYVAHIIRPYSARKSSEIVSAPKVYGFDTGFICYYRGWPQLRQEDMGSLWEHFVLNEIMARMQTRNLSYWRDKRGHEIDFVMAFRGGNPVAIECKWCADKFDATNLKAFRRQHPQGENVVLAADVKAAFQRNYESLKVRFEGLESFVSRMARA
ncbi:MAG: ATP-binding protein [Terracidiphilus sp.]